MKTIIGEIDGNDWEKYCQKLFRLKYADYQEIPARFGGDLGIEGYTKKGLAFQCYCPDDNPNPKELYISQRDKITSDIRKLIKNGRELKKLFGNTVLNQWHFVTPVYYDKQLIVHCSKKAKEIIKEKLSFINNDNFLVLLKTEDDFIQERQILLSSGIWKIDPAIPLIKNEDLLLWKEENISYYKILEKKTNKIISNSRKRLNYILSNIKSYIIGQDTLEKLRIKYPDLYEKLFSLKNTYESKVEKFVNLGLNDHPGQFLNETMNDYKIELEKECSNSVSRKTLIVLTDEAISDWLIRCPLDF